MASARKERSHASPAVAAPGGPLARRAGHPHAHPARQALHLLAPAAPCLVLGRLPGGVGGDLPGEPLRAAAHPAGPAGAGDHPAGLTGVSDDEVIEATVMDRRWQLVLDCLDCERPPFS